MSLSSEGDGASLGDSGTSLDLGTYQEQLERVLAWLLEADDTLTTAAAATQSVNGDKSVQEVKEHFHQHKVTRKSLIRGNLLCVEISYLWKSVTCGNLLFVEISYLWKPRISGNLLFVEISYLWKSLTY